MNVPDKTEARIRLISSCSSRTRASGQRAQGAPEARHLLHPRSLTGTPAPGQTLCAARRGIRRRGLRHGQGVRFRRGGWIAIAMVAVPRLDCREWPSCDLSCGEPGARGDAAHRADMRAGDYAPHFVSRAGPQSPGDCFDAALSWTGWCSRRSISGRKNTARSGES